MRELRDDSIYGVNMNNYITDTCSYAGIRPGVSIIRFIMRTVFTDFYKDITSGRVVLLQSNYSKNYLITSDIVKLSLQKKREWDRKEELRNLRIPLNNVKNSPTFGLKSINMSLNYETKLVTIDYHVTTEFLRYKEVLAEIDIDDRYFTRKECESNPCIMNIFELYYNYKLVSSIYVDGLWRKDVGKEEVLDSIYIIPNIYFKTNMLRFKRICCIYNHIYTSGEQLRNQAKYKAKFISCQAVYLEDLAPYMRDICYSKQCQLNLSLEQVSELIKTIELFNNMYLSREYIFRGVLSSNVRKDKYGEFRLKNSHIRNYDEFYNMLKQLKKELIKKG